MRNLVRIVTEEWLHGLDRQGSVVPCPKDEQCFAPKVLTGRRASHLKRG